MGHPSCVLGSSYERQPSPSVPGPLCSLDAPPHLVNDNLLRFNSGIAPAWGPSRNHRMAPPATATHTFPSWRAAVVIRLASLSSLRSREHPGGGGLSSSVEPKHRPCDLDSFSLNVCLMTAQMNERVDAPRPITDSQHSLPNQTKPSILLLKAQAPRPSSGLG